MKYNFDEVSIEEVQPQLLMTDNKSIYYENLEPFWIADMDIKTPEFIIEHLKNKLDQAHFGYLEWKQDEYLNAIKNWYKKIQR